MPRYGEVDWDPDFDDSPPSSPHLKPAPTPTWKRWYWTWRRNKGLIIFGLFTAWLWYYVSHRRKPFFTPKHSPALRYKNVDWRHYAYSQYATDSHYLCNALMVFDALDRLDSRAGKILMYPEHMDTQVEDGYDRDSQLLVKARDEYGAKLVPIALEGMRTDNWESTDVKNDAELSMMETWDTSISKFLTFNQTGFLRILHLDSDSTILKNLDDLFLLPSARVAMPRAYWKLPKQRQLTSLLILLEPSVKETQRLMGAAEAETRANLEFDMEILNDVYQDSAMVLPHRNFALLSSEFRSGNHTNYHGNPWEVWNPDRALAEASLVHFSDYPIPKPWIMWPISLLEEMMPKCDINPGTPDEKGCRNREIWLNLYYSFRKRRKEVCGLLSVPAPEWPPSARKSEGDTVG